MECDLICKIEKKSFIDSMRSIFEVNIEWFRIESNWFCNRMIFSFVIHNSITGQSQKCREKTVNHQNDDDFIQSMIIKILKFLKRKRFNMLESHSWTLQLVDLQVNQFFFVLIAARGMGAKFN